MGYVTLLRCLAVAEGAPVSLGEGFTPLIELPQLAAEVGVRRLWVKDEAVNPTASFKARGLSGAVTAPARDGVPGLVVHGRKCRCRARRTARPPGSRCACMPRDDS